MQQQSTVFPAVVIEYYRAAPRTASGFCFVLNGNAVSPAELAAALGLGSETMARLKAEAFDLAWPLPAGLVGVTVKHEGGQYGTDCNTQGGRLGIVEYFYGQPLQIVTGHPDEDEDGTLYRVTGLTIDCKPGFKV